MTKFQIITVGSISKVPTATFEAKISSPILYVFPNENDAIEIGNVAIRTAALPVSLSLHESSQKIRG